MESFEQNVGTIDRFVRVGVAVIILIFLLMRGKVSFISAIALIAGGMLLSSATSGVCPLYTQLGFFTTKNS
jgi:uncharacterized membrane protein